MSDEGPGSEWHPGSLQCFVRGVAVRLTSRKKKIGCSVFASSSSFGPRRSHLFLLCSLILGPPLLCCVLVLCSLLVSFVRLRLESAFVSVVGRSGSDHLHTLTSTIPILARLPRCFVSSSLLHRIVLTATSYRSPLLVTLHHRRVLGGLTPRVGSIGGKGICRTSHPDSFPACVSSISF